MMSLAFSTPLFLAGLVLLAVPVLIHLRRRPRTRVVEFPSLMFLHRMPLTMARRRRIQNWLLLALRCGAVATLVLAFARPLVEGETVDGGRRDEGKEIVVLLDHSYSMGAGERWERALAATRREMEAVGEADRASLVAFAERARLLVSSSRDPTEVLEALAGLELSDRGTRFAPALDAAAKILVASARNRGEVVLLSDLQRIGWEADADLRLPPGTEVKVVDLSREPPTAAARPISSGEGTPSSPGVPPNLVLSSALVERRYEGGQGRSGERASAGGRDRARSGGPERVAITARVRLAAEVPVLGARVVLEIGGRELEARDLQVEPESSTLVSFEPFSLPAGVTGGRVSVRGDSLVADNEVFFVLSRAQSLPVLLVEERRRGGRASGLFVAEALDLMRMPPVIFTRRSPGDVVTSEIEGAAVVIWSDARPPRGEIAGALQRRVEAGGGLLLAAGSRTGVAEWETFASLGMAPALGGEPGGREPGGRSARAARIAHFARHDPAFALFSQPRSGDFGAARFFRHHRLVPDDERDRVLARFDDGSAALVFRRVGEGRVMVWTSTLDTYWNDFPLQPVFLPFLHQAVLELAGYRPPPLWWTVGDVVDLGGMRSDMGEGPLRVESPSGDTTEASGSLALERRGLYAVTRGGETAGLLAANVDVAESDLTPMDADELRAALEPIARGATEAAMGGEDPTAVGDERSADQGSPALWRYLLVAVLLILVGESFLANRRARIA